MRFSVKQVRFLIQRVKFLVERVRFSVKQVRFLIERVKFLVERVRFLVERVRFLVEQHFPNHEEQNVPCRLISHHPLFGANKFQVIAMLTEFLLKLTAAAAAGSQQLN